MLDARGRGGRVSLTARVAGPERRRRSSRCAARSAAPTTAPSPRPAPATRRAWSAPRRSPTGQRESIGPLTFEAGHHTVYQHAHFEFGLENVSRQFVWSFLHSHPFYNSEQSQPALRAPRRDPRLRAGGAADGAARASTRTPSLAAWESYRAPAGDPEGRHAAASSASCATSRRTPRRSAARRWRARPRRRPSRPRAT